MTRAEFLSLIPAVLAWSGVVYKLPAFLRRRHEPSIRAFWLSLLFLALALTILLPSVAAWIDHVTGAPNLSRLLGNEVVLFAAWAVQIFVFLTLDYRGNGARLRRRIASWGLVTVLIAMTVLFALAPVHHESTDFWPRYGTARFMLEYRLVYLAYLAFAIVNIVRHSWNYAGITDQPSLSIGLRLVAMGGVLGGGYVGHEGLRVTALAFGIHNAFFDSDTATRLLITGSVGLMVAGVTMPAWGNRLGVPKLYHWFDRHQTYRRLYPLWRALYETSPRIALVPPRSWLSDAFTVRDLDFRLYRRIVEIRDGSLELRPYVDPGVVERARALSMSAGLPEEEARAVAEAASLAAAMDARRMGRAPRSPAFPLELHGGTDVSSEAAALVRVERYFQSSPIVETVVREARQDEAIPPEESEATAGRR